MKLKLNLLTSAMIGFGLLISAVAENAPNKNSAVVIKCRGQVFFQSESENKESSSSSLTRVQTLKSFAGIGSFLVKPNSEVTFFDFRTGNRVTVKLPANAKELRLDVGRGPIRSKSKDVVIKPSQQLAALNSSGLDFQESMGAASSRIMIATNHSPRRRSSKPGQPVTKGPGNPPSPSGPTAGGGGLTQSQPAQPAVVPVAAPVGPPEQLVTINANPSFSLTEKQQKLLGKGTFYCRPSSDDSDGPWTICGASIYTVGKSALFNLGRKMEPGDVFELVRSETPPSNASTPVFLVGRYQEETIKTLSQQKAAAKDLDARLEYLTGLISLKLFQEADYELRQLAKQYPGAQDWDQMRKDFDKLR